METLSQEWCRRNHRKLDATEQEIKQNWARMSTIMSEIGYKECLREWNKDSMTNQEFEKWYKRNCRGIY